MIDVLLNLLIILFFMTVLVGSIYLMRSEHNIILTPRPRDIETTDGKIDRLIAAIQIVLCLIILAILFTGYGISPTSFVGYKLVVLCIFLIVGTVLYRNRTGFKHR